MSTKLDEISNLLEQKVEYNQTPQISAPQKIDENLEEYKKLQNKAFAQDISLKRNTLIVLFIFLALETLVIFIYAFFQAVHSWGFKLEDWSFRLLIAATITQITLMVQVAVKHLFPTPKESS